MNNKELLYNLERFRSKACCSHTEYQANHLWNKIKDELPPEAYKDIKDAWYHAGLATNMREVLHLTVNEWIEKLRKNGHK